MTEYRETIRLNPDFAECTATSLTCSEARDLGLSRSSRTSRVTSWARSGPTGRIPRRNGFGLPDDWHDSRHGCPRFSQRRRPAGRCRAVSRRRGGRLQRGLPRDGGAVLRRCVRRPTELGRGPGCRTSLQRRLLRGSGRASGRAKDQPPPDLAGRVKLRRQALEWLEGDLAARTRIVASGSEDVGPAARRRPRSSSAVRSPTTWPASASSTP